MSNVMNLNYPNELDAALRFIQQCQLNRSSHHYRHSYLGETTAPTAEHLQGLLRPLTAYRYENNRQDRRLAAIDHPRKARCYDYQSSPYTIDSITEEGRGQDTTDWRYFYDAADRLVEAHGGLRQDFSFDYDRADNLTRMATPDGTTIMHPDQTNARDRNESVGRCH